MTKTPEELTEDWKAGKLHKRFDEPKLFYCKTDNGIEILKTWGYKNLEFLSMADEVFEPVDDVQILAPVPTYDEYKAMWNQIVDANKKVEQLKSNNKWLANGQRNWWHRCQKYARENDNLRALLKECKPYLSYFISNNKHVGFTPNTTNLLTCINAAFNEIQANSADCNKIQERNQNETC